MFYRIKTTTGIRAWAIFLVIFMVPFMVCITSEAADQTTKEAQNPAEQKLINEISTDEDSESITVSIKGDSMLTYTSVKQPFPLGVLLYFPETTLDNIEATYTPESDIVDSINASEFTEDGHTSRIEILLKEDVPYEIIREDQGLKISFQKVVDVASGEEKTEEPEAASSTSVVQPDEASMVTATRLESVETTQLDDGVKVFVRADGAIKDFKSFTVESPPRIVFDIFNIKSPFKKEQVIPVDSKRVQRIRHYGHPDKIRLVLDTYKSYLYAFSATPDKDGLMINVGGDMGVSSSGEKEAEYESTGTAWVNRVDFSSEDAGKSTVIIGTTKPVKYDIKKTEVDKLQLKLINTRLPDDRKLPLITTRFDAAVDRITPVQTTAMKDTTLVAIELREAVPYFIEQIDNLLLIHFEASSISPKSLEEADLPPWKKILAKAVAEAESEVEEEMKADVGGSELEGEKIYTGEKIAIDFYDTDIKNVFRILREVSSQNFAIDKDVSGKVTLSLEKPVPWDQILDLILKMNKLGMTHEGNIVRIATLTTLEEEEKIAVKKKVSERKIAKEEKAEEPLITEYISINYANAQSDVLPHIVKSDRGTISVDARNNQIIITDVVENIANAKEIVKKIDQVTPQVIIEARIVDASSSFTKSIGTSWGAQMGISDGKQLGKIGGDVQLTAAASNPPSNSLGAFGINFSRLVGTTLELNATILAAETQGQTKVISTPKIVTLDNTPASIKQGISYPINKLDADGNTTTEYKDIALELTVTPHVTPDNRISMKINIKNNELAEAVGNNISFSTKEASTELLVNDGDTVVIGGIRKDTESSDQDGVPGLLKIPVLGWLFKSKNRDETKRELLIFITPRIVQLEQRG